MSNDEDLKHLKEFAGLMMRWSRSAEERLNAFADKMDALAEAQANSEVKIAALADAQIRTEAAMETMAQRVGESMSALAAAQTHTDQRLDALIDIVRKRFESKPQG